MMEFPMQVRVAVDVAGALENALKSRELEPDPGEGIWEILEVKDIKRTPEGMWSMTLQLRSENDGDFDADQFLEHLHEEILADGIELEVDMIEEVQS